MRRAAAAALAALLAAGCAASGPPPVPVPVPRAVAAPDSGAIPVPAPRRPATVRASAPAALDSLPSRDALEVLASIPEPIQGSTPVPLPVPTVPPVVSPPAPEPAPEPALGDSVTQAVTAIDHGVPVPSPTRPMGDDPDAPVSMPTTEPVNPATPPAVPAAPVSPPAPSDDGAASAADSVWRVQVAAPAERDKAEHMRDAARSLLLVPFVIEREGGLHKVRSEQRLPREVAERLRARAVGSGFVGAFLLRQPVPR